MYKAFGKCVAYDPSAKTGKAKKDREAYEASAALSLAFAALGTFLGTAVVAVHAVAVAPAALYRSLAFASETFKNGARGLFDRGVYAGVSTTWPGPIMRVLVFTRQLHFKMISNPDSLLCAVSPGQTVTSEGVFAIAKIYVLGAVVLATGVCMSRWISRCRRLCKKDVPGGKLPSDSGRKRTLTDTIAPSSPKQILYQEVVSCR